MESPVFEDIDTIRILLTENCNASCVHCFNKDIREDRHMDKDRLFSLLEQISPHIPKLKIMGGEPTVHPEFKKIYEFAQSKFEKVSLFTNSLNEGILDIVPRRRDTIIYNFGLVGKGFNFDKLLPAHKFGRTFEVMIGTTTDMPSLQKNILRTVERSKELGIYDSISFNITLNCVENIFEHREVLNKMWRDIARFLYSIDLESPVGSFDHKVPMCFWTDETRKFMEHYKFKNYYHATCRPGTYGLIDASFNILFCNQHPIKLGSIFDGDEMISFSRLNLLLYKAYMEKQIMNLSRDCMDCSFAVNECTGGCFMHKYVDTNPGGRIAPITGKKSSL